MCHIIHVSTSSQKDLTQLPTELYQFVDVDRENDGPTLNLLAHPNKFLLLCRYGGCSCHYRHSGALGTEPWFGPPEDWNPEDEDDIESTRAVYEVFKRIVDEGHKLDVLCTWNSENLENVRSMDVSLSDVLPEVFRFFEGVRFEVSP